MTEKIIQLARRILKTELHVVEARFTQGRRARLVETDAGSYQVAVKTKRAGFADDDFEIAAGKRLPARQPELDRACRAGLAQDADPLGGRQLTITGVVIERIGAVDAMQRASIGKFRQ